MMKKLSFVLMLIFLSYKERALVNAQTFHETFYRIVPQTSVQGSVTQHAVADFPLACAVQCASDVNCASLNVRTTSGGTSCDAIANSYDTSLWSVDADQSIIGNKMCFNIVAKVNTKVAFS